MIQKLAVIAHNPGTTLIVEQVITENALSCSVHLCSHTQCEEKALELERKGISVIIAFGVYANLIRNTVAIQQCFL